MIPRIRRPTPSPIEFYKQTAGLVQLSNEMVQLQHDVATAVNDKLEEADNAITEIKSTQEEIVTNVTEKLEQVDENLQSFSDLEEKIEKTLEEKEGPEGPAGADADEQYIIQEVLASLNVEKLVSEAVSKLPKPKQINEKTLTYKILEEVKKLIPEEIDYEAIVDKLLSSKKIKLDQVEGIHQALNKRQAYYHGGGDTVQAGNNVTITESNGKKIINASGGASYNDPTSGTVDGVNTVFTFATAPSAIISDGRTFFENHGYTLVGTTVTLDNAPQEYIKSQ